LINLAILGGGIAVKIHIPKFLDDTNCTKYEFFEDLKELNQKS